MKGPYHSYRSDYPNQVHQLNFSLSQNYYVLKNGEIHYQAKKFDINWKNFDKTGKRHLVNYLIRDHFSGCFYAEIFPVDNIAHIGDFLFDAWRQKTYYEFCGVPANMIIGRHILERWPELQNLKQTLDVNIELAQNGFATGVRAVRDWEHSIKYYSIFENYKTLPGFQQGAEIICRDLNLRQTGKTDVNLIKWMENEPRGQVINDKATFDRLFRP